MLLIFSIQLLNPSLGLVLTSVWRMSADVEKTEYIAKHQNKIFMIRKDFPVCVDCMKQTSFEFTEK